MKPANLSLTIFLAFVFTARVVAAESQDKLRVEAERGDAVAAYNLGIAYLSGNGLGKDPTQAATWIAKAADQGLAEAQDALGIMYLSGNGVGKDAIKAGEWIRKAAMQGNLRAQDDLAVIYLSGMGIPTDKIEGAAWLSVESDSGDESVKKQRDQVMNGLSAEQASAVQSRAAALRAQIVNSNRHRTAMTSRTGMFLDASVIVVLLVPLGAAFYLNRRQKRDSPDQRSFFWGYCFGVGIMALAVAGMTFYCSITGMPKVMMAAALIFALLGICLGILVIKRHRWAFVTATILLFVGGLATLGNSGNHPTGNAAFDAGRGLTNLAFAFVVPVCNVIYIVRRRREFSCKQATADEGQGTVFDSSLDHPRSVKAGRNANVFVVVGLAVTVVGIPGAVALWRHLRHRYVILIIGAASVYAFVNLTAGMLLWVGALAWAAWPDRDQ